MQIQKVNTKQKLGLFVDYWSPKIVGQINDSYVKLVRVLGEFVWHHHENEDELFFVLKGRLKIMTREEEIVLNEGEFVIIPKGVEHKPVAEEEVHLMLLEPITTVNTGNLRNEMTSDSQWI